MYIDGEAAIEIYYYMIAVDGEVKQVEMEKYMEIVKETAKMDYCLWSEMGRFEWVDENGCETVKNSISMDDPFELKEEAVEEFVGMCNKRLEQAIDEDEYFDIIKERIDEIIEESVHLFTGTSTIEVTRFIWNLLSIAASDKEYSAIEQKLIRYVVRKLDIDKGVYLEMENAMKAIKDINKEIDCLKMSNRPYGVVESMVKEMSERQEVIFDSVKALIADNGEV